MNRNDEIKVLVVDDSMVMRKLLSDLINNDPEIRVIGTAKNGIDALEKISKLKPDVVTLDIEMPKMDGLIALQHIMDRFPIPVIMVSAMNLKQADITMKALDFGAVDFFPKTSGPLSLDMDKVKKELIEKIKVAVTIKISKNKKIKIPKLRKKKIRPVTDNYLVVIGASTGGPKAIIEILSRLPRDFPAPILIVQHMPEGFTKSFAERLNRYSSIEVKEAENGDLITKGMALVAPGDKHMLVKNGHIILSNGPMVNNVRPSIDVTMESVSKCYGSNSIGVIMSGMGSDGALGMKDIKNAGGKTIAQDKETAVVYGMSKAAIELHAVDKISPLSEIAEVIISSLEV